MTIYEIFLYSYDFLTTSAIGLFIYIVFLMLCDELDEQNGGYFEFITCAILSMICANCVAYEWDYWDTLFKITINIVYIHTYLPCIKKFFCIFVIFGNLKPKFRKEITELIGVIFEHFSNCEIGRLAHLVICNYRSACCQEIADFIFELIFLSVV